MEKELKKKAKVAKLEVNEKDMAGRIIHLIEGHFGPSEKALTGVATTLLPLLFRCWSMVFRCEESSPSDGSFGNAFVEGAGSGGSSSSSSVPSLLSDSSVSRRSEWSVVPEEGAGERATLSPFPVIDEMQIEEGSTGGGSPFSSGESGSGWFSPERHALCQGYSLDLLVLLWRISVGGAKGEKR